MLVNIIPLTGLAWHVIRVSPGALKMVILTAVTLPMYIGAEM